MQDNSAKQVIKRILLSDAVRQIVEALSVSDEEAGERIRQACGNQEIKSFGDAPLSLFLDIKKAWKMAAGAHTEQIRQSDWNMHKANLIESSLGRYRSVCINADDFIAWLKNTRTKPKSDRGPGRPPGALIDDTKALTEIKKLMSNGIKLTEACKNIAKKYPGHSEKSTYERLRKKQREGKIK